MMLRKRIKFGIFALLFTFTLSGIGGVVSANGAESEDESVPNGFTVTKVYTQTDPEYYVDVTEAGVIITPEMTSSILKSSEESGVKTEVLENTTRRIRELSNLETGEEKTQYATDISIMAFTGDSKYDPTGGVKLSITIYSSTYNNGMYIGMDKLYYRWDKEDSTISSISTAMLIIQNGAGLTHGVTDQIVQDPNNPGNPLTITPGYTYNWIISSNWEPVLKDSGGMEHVGAKFVTTLKRGSTTWSFPFGIMLVGSFPVGP